MSEPTPSEKPRGGWARRGAILAGALVVAVGLYYVAGAVWLSEIDDDPDFAASVEVPENGSHAVAVAAALIDREVNIHRWVANDPWFQPAAILDNMPNYQNGIVAALSRFGVELTDHIARARGTSQVDPDADSAAGRLKYPGDVWIFEWSSTPVQSSSESQYRKAIEDLHRYNARVAAGQANFERRADNLMATLERVAADIGGSSAALSRRIEDYSDAWMDLGADDLFYATKGRLYAYYLLLEALGVDYAGVLAERNVERTWQDMLTSFRDAAALQPWIVSNGEMDGQAVPNHLAAQGFLLLRARFQLYEVSNILLK